MPEAPKLAWRRTVLGGAERRWLEISGAVMAAAPRVLMKRRRERVGMGGTMVITGWEQAPGRAGGR